MTARDMRIPLLLALAIEEKHMKVITFEPRFVREDQLAELSTYGTCQECQCIRDMSVYCGHHASLARRIQRFHPLQHTKISMQCSLLEGDNNEKHNIHAHIG